MRRSLLVTLLVLATAVPLALSGSLFHSYAQAGPPQGDEFNNPTFTPPFAVVCAKLAANCPDPAGPATWSLDTDRPGYLRIWSQFGSLLGTPPSAATNNARNMVLQPVSSYADWTVTTAMTFPGSTLGSSPTTALGQTAGILVYQDDDNFIFVGRTYTSSIPTLEFVQESAGVDTTATVSESTTNVGTTVYLRLVKSANLYQAYYSYDNVNFTPFTTSTVVTPTPTTTGTATPTATPIATTTPSTLSYSPSPAYTTPQLGLFAFGGTDPRVNNNLLAADFDWFRVGTNSLTPAPTALPTATGTPLTTATATPTATPTSTPVPAATATPTPTSIPTPTNTPLPTPTPLPPPPTPRPAPYTATFAWTSVWYHHVRIGTIEHLQAQAKKHIKHGIWVHVYFGSGKQMAFYTATDSHGQWNKDFTVPSGTISRYSHEAVVTYQLWYHKSSAKSFQTFSVIH